MLWNVICIIGILLIVNGLFMIQQGKVLSDVRKSIGEVEDIVSGTAKGLLFLTSTDIMLAVDERGFVKKAFKIKSGYLRITQADSLEFEDRKVDSLVNDDILLKKNEQRACDLAVKKYQQLKNKRKR